MKKVFAAIVCALILSGCGSQEADLPQRVLSQLEALPQQTLTIGSNRTKPYYSYYLPMGMGQRDANELSEVLIKEGYRMIMNFDPSTIVIEQYYSEKEETADTLTSPTEQKEIQKQFLQPKMEEQGNKIVYTGNYLTSGLEIYPYTLQLIKSEDFYLIYFDGSLVKIYTYVPAAAVSSSLKAMITLASSIQYDKEAVLKQYSLKSLPDTKKQTLDYLEQHLPSTGNLDELLNPDDPMSDGPMSDMPQ